MPGLFRFDFYPKDWHLDTRDLSCAAKGVFIDILCAIYARGGGIPNDERELCRITGCATARSLRPLLAELLDKGKLRLVDGLVINGRAAEEIAKYEGRSKAGRKGGKARSARVRAELGANSTGTEAETQGDIVENQGGDIKLSPSPSPSIDSVGDKSPPGAPAPIDLKKPLFDLGTRVLGPRTGGMVTNLIKHHSGDLAATMQTLEFAAGKSNPREWVGAILNGERRASTEAVIAETDALYRRLGVLL